MRALDAMNTASIALEPFTVTVSDDVLRDLTATAKKDRENFTRDDAVIAQYGE